MKIELTEEEIRMICFGLGVAMGKTGWEDYQKLVSKIYSQLESA